MAKLARAEVFDPSEVTIVRNQMGTHTLLTCRTALFEKGHSICSGCSCAPIWVESQWAGNGLRSLAPFVDRPTY